MVEEDVVMTPEEEAEMIAYSCIDYISDFAPDAHILEMKIDLTDKVAIGVAIDFLMDALKELP